ncbi:MAG: cytochrome c oxidase assembly protein [Acidimicrobiales bacterium]
MFASPAWHFHLYLASWLIVGGLGAGYALLLARGDRQSIKGRCCAVGGLLALLVATNWPLADFATSRSLSALTVQRLILLLAAPPLLVIGMPSRLLAVVTRPPLVDWVIRRSARPAVAVVIVTVVVAGTLTTEAVKAEATSAWARGGFDLALIVGGLILWTPVMNELPGTDRPSALGRAGYLIIQSIVPSFLAIIWIFSRHPLYAPFAHGAATNPALFAQALRDQQIAGFIAKFATIAVLWTVAFVSLSRTQHAIAEGRDPEPLLWSDVQRRLERAERRERRNVWLPPSYKDPSPRDLFEHDEPQQE